MIALPAWIEALKSDAHTDPRAIEALEIALETMDMTTGFCINFRQTKTDCKDHQEVGHLFAYIDSQKRRIDALGKE